MSRLVHAPTVLGAALVVLAYAAAPARVADDPARMAAIERPRQPPDLVLVTIDALRRDHMSLHGYHRLTTPTLDAFARDAVTFANAIAQAPYTKASVASLMTGLYPSVHKTTTSSVPFPEAMTGHPSTTPLQTDVLPAPLTTLAEALRGAGYQTIGLTANPFLSEAFGFDQGFDRFAFFPGADFVAGDRLIDAALAAVEHAGPAPVFLWVHLMEPHSPYVPPAWTDRMFALTGPFRPIAPEIEIPGWLVPGQPRDLREYEVRYDEDIAAADAEAGVLLRELARLRDPSNTVVVLTSDHGEEFLDHGGWEHGSSLHDELVRVPLILKAPRIGPRVVQSPLELSDLYPVLLALAGSGARAGAVQTWLDDLDAIDRPAFSELVDAQWAIRWRGWKLIRHADGREQLFDLEHDPRERLNVVDVERTRLADLRRMLDRIRESAAARGPHVRPERRVPPPSILRRLRSLGYVGT